MSLLGIIGKAATGFATGGITGAVLGVASGIASAGKNGDTTGTSILDRYKTAASAMPGSGTPSIFPSALPMPDSIKVTGSGVVLPGGFAAGSTGATAYFTPTNTSVTMPQQQNGHCMTPGHRMNKTGYFLKSGQYVAPGTKCVKSRRRNPLNPRALSRAMGRLASAKKAAKALDRFEVKGRRCR